ncbi:MAG: hypothetical protein DMF49_06805 [Acidobacteria bacterium]|nr:MAG: hypothetical protein DMF49_06805 [Acidobacteriota bacterium]
MGSARDPCRSILPLAVAALVASSSLCLSGPAFGRADEPGAEGAIAGLSAQIEVEREILKKDRQRYRMAAAARDEATARLSVLYSQIDSLAKSEDQTATEALEAKSKDIAAAEQAREGGLGRCKEALEQIRERLERILLLDQKVATLKNRRRSAEEPLTGAWDVTISPTGEHGFFALKQSGTILSGQYTMRAGRIRPEGGETEGEAEGAQPSAGILKGNLEGTFTGGKIYLQRIDSKLGRFSELEGYLDSSGRAVRGTWQNYDLTNGQPAAGSWTAVRRFE